MTGEIAEEDSPQSACTAAPAKLNLTLHITGKRTDGYHELDSLVAFALPADPETAER